MCTGSGGTSASIVAEKRRTYCRRPHAGSGGSTMNNQRITTQFGAQSTAAEVIAGIDLTGRRAIVTGGASGIGVETARALASAKAEVTLAVRNLEAGERVADEIAASTGNKQVLVTPLDLTDPASIGALIARWSGPLHLLVNNAGGVAVRDTRT